MKNSEQLYKLIWMSRPLMQAAENAVERGLDGTGLTVRTRAILEILHAENEATVPAIAQKLEINRQYVQLMVNETLAENLTVRCENPRHKKSAIIKLTSNGRGLIEDVVRREMALVRSINAEMNASDVDTALKVVTALAEKLKSETGGD